MDTNDLRAVFEENESLAPDPETILQDVNLARRPSPSRQSWVWLAAVIAVVLVLGAVGLIARTSTHGSGPAAAPAPSSTAVAPSRSSLAASVTSSPGSPVPSVTAGGTGTGVSDGSPPSPAALAAGHWSRLPAAPIKGRVAAASTWTGTDMFVWGGQDDPSGKLFADGALYNPATRSWHLLPASPLTARSGASAFWTGRTVLVLGGTPGGATYQPATGAWRTIAAAPAGCPHSETVVWTGTVAAILDTSAAGIVACLYDPAADAWTPPMNQQQPVDHDSRMLSAVAIGSTVYVFSAWTHTEVVRTAPGGITETGGSGGVDSSALDVATGTWTTQTWSPDQPKPFSPLAIGTQIFTPAQAEFSGVHSYPPTFGETGLIRTPRTGTVVGVPHGPIDDLRGEYVWTGTSVLGFNTGTFMSGPGGVHEPGEAAVLDPATGSWTSLPGAPLTAQREAAVWTGHELLMWGQMYAGSTGAARPQDAGLSFGP